MEFAQEHFNDEYYEREESEEPDSEMISDMLDLKSREDCEEFEQMRECEEEYDASQPRTRVIEEWIQRQDADLPEDSRFRTRKTIHNYEAENEMRKKEREEELQNTNQVENNTAKNAENYKIGAEDLQEKSVQKSKPKRKETRFADAPIVRLVERSELVPSSEERKIVNNKMRIRDLENALRRAESDDQREELNGRIEELMIANRDLQKH